MNVEIVKTASRSISDEHDISIRTVRIDGVMHLQMQGRDHEIMRPTWGRGVVMTCPNTVDVDAIVNDPAEYDRYYSGYGDGCEILDGIPVGLT